MWVTPLRCLGLPFNHMRRSLHVVLNMKGFVHPIVGFCAITSHLWTLQAQVWALRGDRTAMGQRRRPSLKVFGAESRPVHRIQVATERH